MFCEFCKNHIDLFVVILGLQMCIRDLRAYKADFDSHISYYRDRYGLEADLVLHLADSRYALITPFPH